MHLAVSFLNEEELSIMWESFKRIDTEDRKTIDAKRMTAMLTRSTDDVRNTEAVRRIVEVCSNCGGHKTIQVRH